MKIERVVTVFDNATEKLEGEINIDYVDLDQLIKIFSPPADDPSMYDVYEIKPGHIPGIIELMREKIAFDLHKNTYYVECNQLPPYDFGKKKEAESIKVKRVISSFDKSTELMVSEKSIDSIDLDTLKTIFTPRPKDPLMFTPYDITEKEAKELSRYVDIEFDFGKYFYQLDCFQA